MEFVYVDFSQVFDKVSNGMLIWKVRPQEIKGELDKLIQNWFSGRSQGIFSDWRPVKRNVAGSLQFIS